MPSYSYRARDKTGKAVSGVLEAENQRALIEKLRSMDYFVASVKEEVAASAISADILEPLRRISGKDLVVFYHQLAVMIASGLTLTTALSVLSEQIENKKLRRIAEEVRASVEEGNALSSSVEKHPRVFSKLFISMVRAGEASGTLEGILNRVATFTEEAEELRGEIKSALTYPIVIVCGAIVVVIFLTVKVIPKFTAVLGTAGSLPLPTRLLMGLSDLIRHRWYFIILAIAGLVFAVWQFVRTEGGRFLIDRLKLKLPIFGPLIGKVAIARFARTFGTLIASGVPIMQSLRIVEETIGNAVLAKGIDNVCDQVNRGESMSEPLRRSEGFPPMISQMVAIGEETGTLDEVLSKISDFYDREIKYAVSRLTSLIEPITLALVGAMIAFIALSLILPMFNMYGEIGK